MINTKSKSNIFLLKLLRQLKSNIFWLFIFILCQISLNAYTENVYAESDISIEAPINKDFINYIEQKQQSRGIEKTSMGYTLGEVPSPNTPNFDGGFPSKETFSVTDSVFDLRTAGSNGTSLVTPVKNQGNCGACWTFATMGSIESTWKKNFGTGDVDLSEDNLNNCHGFDWLPCDGGNLYMSAAYLSRKSGPVLESQDPYTATSNSCPTGLLEASYIGDIRFLPKDTSLIKQAIINYGALYTNMRWEDSYYNSGNKTYYYSESNPTNHAVLLIGWDDNKVTNGGTGAWIIKNSWGTSWGENGFFYISYNDAKVNSLVGYLPTKLNYDEDVVLYFYDKLGDVSKTGYSNSDTGYGLVKYTATSNQSIYKIGTWIEGSNATVDIEIYSSFDGSTLSGLLDSLSNQSCSLPGYYTFDLVSPINLNANQDFYIKVKYYTPNYSYPIPIEKSLSDYSSNVAIETGKCWKSSNGTSWTAIGNNTSNVYDLCIKAYNKVATSTITTTSTTITTSTSTTTKTLSKKANMEIFATRFYQYFLGRLPDAGGLDYWSNLMANKTRFPVDVALDFMYSQEFINMNTTNSQFVDVLYRAIMGREADSGGKTYWISVLDNGQTREDVLRRFANSQEFSDICTNYGITPFDYAKDFVTRFYRQCLDREPDQAGLDYWTNKLKTGSLAGCNLARNFILSQEFINKNLSNSDFAKVLYRSFFDREPDSGGYQYWLNYLNDGQTRESTLANFIGSEEFKNLCSKYDIKVK